MKKAYRMTSLVTIVSLLLFVCLVNGTGLAQGKKVIGISRNRMDHEYDVAMVREFAEALEEAGLDWEIVIADAQMSVAKQVNDIEDLIVQGVDAIVMCPTNPHSFIAVSKDALQAGIPVILVDRTISSDDFTAFIGGDNLLIGEYVAQAIGEMFKDLGEVLVVEVQGTLGASATIDRHNGFRAKLEDYPNVKVISDNSGDYTRSVALHLMEDILQAEPHIDAVYAHNDAMAMGILAALQASGREGVIIFSADGSIEAMDEIKAGRIAGTVRYPTGSAEAVEVLQKIFAGKDFDRITMLDVPLVTIDNVDEYYDSAY